MVADGDGEVSGRMEVGIAEMSRGSGDGWVRISFGSRIDDAVVVVGPLSSNDSDPTVVQIRNASSTGFEARLQELNYLDGRHGTESFSWMAGTRGSHELADGIEINFGSTSVAGWSERTIAFDGGSSTPLFFGTLHKYGPATPALRVSEVGSDYAKVSMALEESLETNKSWGGARTLDWVTMSPASGSDVKSGILSLDHGRTTIRADRGDALFAEMQTLNSDDYATVRTDNRDGTRLYVAEDQSRDSETGHRKETVAWASVDVGRQNLYESDGIPADQPDPTPDVAPSSDSASMEVGQVSMTRASGEGWVRVSFAEAIPDAVVVVGPLTSNDSAPVTAQVRNVGSNGFDVRLNEWTYQDGRHGTETITWVAGTEGTHAMTNGEAITFGQGRVTTGGNTFALRDDPDDQVVFASAFGDGDHAVTFRLRDVGSNSFRGELDFEEGFRGKMPGASRELAWVSVDADSSNVGRAMISDAARQIDADARTPLLAGIQTQTSHNTTVVRAIDGPGNRRSLFLEEEQSRDAETRHPFEDVAWLKLQAGWKALSAAAPVPMAEVVFPVDDHDHDHGFTGHHHHDCGCGCHDHPTDHVFDLSADGSITNLSAADGFDFA